MAKAKRSDFTLRTRTAPSIYDGFQALMYRVARRRLAPLPQSSKGTAEAVLSAIVLHFLETVPEAEQDAVIQRNAPLVHERILRELAALGADVSERPDVGETHVHRAPPSPRRRKAAP